MKQIVPFFLGIIKIGATYLGLLLRFNTLMFIDLLTSNLKVSLFILGIGKGLVWYCLAHSKSSIIYSDPM